VFRRNPRSRLQCRPAALAVQETPSPAAVNGSRVGCAYEVKLRVANGDQYDFDAIHDGERWQLACCGHRKGSEIP